MRAFVILCFIALCAADVSEVADNGYNYDQPSGGSDAMMHDEGSHEGSGGSEGDSNSRSEVEYSSGSGGDYSSGSDGDLGAGSASEPSLSGGGLRASVSMRPEFGYEPAGGQPTVSKRFFTYTALNRDDDDDDDDAYSRGGGHKNYDIVFANAPAPSIKSALKAFANFAGQHQTDVYVLSKQLGAGEIGNALRASGIKPNKPKVHFVKYKTPEEAAYAQQQIRAQYDRLGGRSENGGHETAPVQSVVGSLGGYRRAQYNSHSHGGYSHSGESHSHDGHSFSHGGRGQSSHGNFKFNKGPSTGIPPLPFATKQNKYLPPRY